MRRLGRRDGREHGRVDGRHRRDHRDVLIDRFDRREPGTTDASGTETVGATTSGTTEGSTSVGATTEEETSVGATTGFCEIILPEPLPETLEDATVGVYYEVTLSMPGVGQDEALWSTDDALPGWLTLDPDTGVLSGTPDAPGEVSFGVQGTVKDAPPDCGVLPGSRAYTLTVAP